MRKRKTCQITTKRKTGFHEIQRSKYPDGVSINMAKNKVYVGEIRDYSARQQNNCREQRQEPMWKRNAVPGGRTACINDWR